MASIIIFQPLSFENRCIRSCGKLPGLCDDGKHIGTMYLLMTVMKNASNGQVLMTVMKNAATAGQVCNC